MTDYLTAADYEGRHRITEAATRARIPAALTAASREVDRRTGRTFGPQVDGDPVATDDTVRYFHPVSPCLCYIDDCYSITSVAVDWGNAGTYDTAWTTTDYQTLPLNGVGPDGQSGWSTYALESYGTLWFPVGYRRPTVKVTGKWGWAAIPTAIVEATHLLANRLMFENDTPSGVVAGEFGGVPLRRQWTVEDLLRPYVRGDRQIGIAG